MSKSTEFIIKTEKEFSEAKNLVDTFLLLDKRLPEQVFKAPYDNLLFTEDCWLAERYWEDIQLLAKQSNDTEILLFVEETVFNLGDSRLDRYVEPYGYIDYIKFPVDTTYKEYASYLTERRAFYPNPPYPNSQLDFIKNCSAIIPPSGKWAIYIDVDFELSILTYNNNFDVSPLVAKDYWTSFDILLEWHYLVSKIYEDRPDLFKRLKENYG